MRIMALDDEQFVLDNLVYLLEQFSDVEVAYVSTDSVDALAKIEEMEINALFLDINMPRINGMELAERVHQLNPNIAIVFITAYSQYALDSFRVNAVDYLLKPVTTTKLQRTIDRLRKMIGNTEKLPASQGTYAADTGSSHKITGMRNGKYFVIDYDEALYIFAEQRSVYLMTKDAQYQLKHNITYWEAKLVPHGWFRSHRAFLINVKMIQSAVNLSNSVYCVRMKNHMQELPVSRSYLNEFKRLLDI